MNYENYTFGQKVLAHATARKIENTGCTTDECVQVLSDMVGLLLAFMAPSKAELIEYIDNKLVPYLRNTSIEEYDQQHQII